VEAADRTSWVAWQPARMRLFNLSASSGRYGSEVTLGTSVASQFRHRQFVIGIGESYLELLLEDSGGAAELSCPGGSQVAGIDLGGGTPYLYVGDQLSRHRNVRRGPGRPVGCDVEADSFGELGNPL
jgi:hypothetical protein